MARCQMCLGNLRHQTHVYRVTAGADPAKAGFTRTASLVASPRGAFRSVRPQHNTAGDKDREHRRAEVVYRAEVDVLYGDEVVVDGQPQRFRVTGVEWPYKESRRWQRVTLAWQNTDNPA